MCNDEQLVCCQFSKTSEEREKPPNLRRDKDRKIWREADVKNKEGRFFSIQKKNVYWAPTRRPADETRRLFRQQRLCLLPHKEPRSGKTVNLATVKLIIGPVTRAYTWGENEARILNLFLNGRPASSGRRLWPVASITNDISETTFRKKCSPWLGQKKKKPLSFSCPKGLPSTTLLRFFRTVTYGRGPER